MNILLALLVALSFFNNAYAVDPEQRMTQEIRKGTVKGRIMVKDNDGIPLSWGQIMFYDKSTGPPPLPYKYERVPDILRYMDAEGKFAVKIPVGKYYMGAIKRLSEDRLGPPKEGDYIYRSLNEKGEPKEYEVKEGESIDVGTISEAFPIQLDDFLKRRVTTAIEGKIINMEWEPVADAVVVAFVQPIIGRKPLFVSNKSDKDGKYILPVTEGTYYLRVRNSFAAGPPEPGQIIGYFGEGIPAPISVKDEEIVKEINMQVVIFRGRGPAPRPAPKDK
jgi:hypothetical protein